MFCASVTLLPCSGRSTGTVLPSRDEKMFRFCHRIDEAEHYGKRAKVYFYQIIVTAGEDKGTSL